MGYLTLADTVVSARTFPVFTNFAASARANSASFSPVTASSPHGVVIFEGEGGTDQGQPAKIRHEIESDTSRYSESYPNRYWYFRNIIRR